MRRLTVALAVLLALGVSGCGEVSEEDLTPSSPEPTLVEPEVEEVEILKGTRVGSTRVSEGRVTLLDGRTVTCLLTPRGGIHCFDPEPR